MAPDSRFSRLSRADASPSSEAGSGEGPGGFEGGAAQSAGSLADRCELPFLKPGCRRPLHLSLGRRHSDAGAPETLGWSTKDLPDISPPHEGWPNCPFPSLTPGRETRSSFSPR